jgi:hypothetical protein
MSNVPSEREVMGDPAEPTPSDRQQIRDRARAILAAVTNDESVAKAAGLYQLDAPHLIPRGRVYRVELVHDLLTMLAQEVEALAGERDENARIGLSMCRVAHNLTTVIGSGEYARINEAWNRLEGVQDVRDLATLLADSEERARNSERAAEQLRKQVQEWRNWSDEVAPPFGSARDRSDEGQRKAISDLLSGSPP